MNRLFLFPQIALLVDYRNHHPFKSYPHYPQKRRKEKKVPKKRKRRKNYNKKI